MKKTILIAAAFLFLAASAGMASVGSPVPRDAGKGKGAAKKPAPFAHRSHPKARAHQAAPKPIQVR